MIELPRAALTAGRIAEAADFFSFGTNDLTQTAWELSRDDVEASFFPRLPRPGRLRHLALRDPRPGRRRPTGPDRRRGGPRDEPDPEDRRLRRTRRRPNSIHFFHDTGLDYVSCSPFRVPAARLEAGRASLANRADGASAAT